MNKELKICDECKSEYFAETSKMMYLCPNCSHYLHGYENCNHHFKNGRCIHCYWNGKILILQLNLKNQTKETKNE